MSSTVELVSADAQKGTEENCRLRRTVNSKQISRLHVEPD